MAFDYDDNGAPVGSAGGFNYDESGNPLTTAKPAESGIFGTLGGGAAQTARSVGAFADLAQGDTPELQAAAAAQAARVKDPRLAAFEADLAQRRERLGKDPSWLDVIGEVGSAAWKNPAGAGLMTVDQLPNSAAVLAGGGAGALAGSTLGPAGTAAGGIIGGIAGMYAGNMAVEGGSRALEHVGRAGDLSSEDRSRLLYEGAVKAGVITTVDAATLGLTKFITNATRRAVETATLRVAEQAGVSATEIAARRAADPALDAAITSAQKLAAEGANTFGKRAMQTGAALGLETIGEGLGEYLGEFAATGEADKMDAVIEAFSSLGQSAAEVGIAKVWNSRTPTIDDIDKAPDIEGAIATAEAELAAPVEALGLDVDDWKGFNDTLYVAPRREGQTSADVMSEDQLADYDQYRQTTIPARNAPLVADATQEAQARLDTVQGEEGTTDLEARRPKTILKRAVDSIDDNELRAILSNPETSAVTARAVHVELAARERAATPTVEGTGGTNELRTTMGGTTVTIPDAAPAKNNTVAEAVAILRTPAEQRVPADTVRLRNVAARIGPEAMARIEQFVKGPALLTREERIATERMIASDGRTAPAPTVTPVTLDTPVSQQRLADNEAGLFSQPRRTMFRNSQLRSETGPDIKGEKVTRNMRKALSLMGRITGTKVIYEYAPEDSDGAVPNRTENTIHINTAAQINPMQVMGHEVTHVLKDKHRAAWDKVRDTLVATMTDKQAALDAFASNYWGGNEENLQKLAAARAMPDWSVQLTPEQKTQFGTSENTIEDFLLDEMVSDLGGQHWSSEKFWTDVFAKIEAQEGARARSIIERLVMSIKEMLGKFLEVVRAQRQDDFATVSAEQIEATRDAITTAYAKLIRAERRTEPDGRLHDTHHRIGTSDTHSRSSGVEGEPPTPATKRQGVASPDTADIDDLEAARARELASLSPARTKRDQRLFFEVAPNPNDKAAVAAWKKRTDKQKRDISNEVVSRIIPGLLADLHVTGKVVTQLGGWMDDTNPSFALVVSRGDPLLAARAIGYVLDQEAVYALGLKSFTGAKKTGIIHIDIAGKDAHKIYMQIRALDRDAISGHSTIGNEMLIGLPIDRMNELEQDINTIARKEDVLVSLDEGYGATIKEYGYGIRNEARDSRKQRTEAGYVNHWRAEARAATGGFRSDAAGNGSDRTGAVFSSNRPSYGTVRTGTGVSAVGVHYSQAERPTLSSRFFGTGMKGEERARIMHSNDERIKRRLYFYTNEGAGITPESGVGSHAHSVLLNNLYDLDVDQDNLFRRADPNKDWRDQPIPPSLLMNYTEAAIIDAGYDGYLTHQFGKGGAIVLLGDHSVPVQYEGLGVRPDVPVAEHAKPTNYHSMKARVVANKSMPSGQMAGRDWKNLVPALMKGIDVSHLDDDTMYYKDQIVKKPEPARRSEARPVPKWYRSALADEAAAVTAKSMPVSGWQGWIKGLRANGKVKPDEITWSGIEDFIAAHGDVRITADAVREYLSEFGVKVQTLLRGESNPRTYDTDVQIEEDEDEYEDIEPDFSWGMAETEEPDESWLYETARNRYDDAVERKVDDEWDAIADDMRGYISHWSSFEEEAREQLGALLNTPREQVIAAAEALAIRDAAQESFEYYKTDDDPDYISEQELVERAVRILSDDDLTEQEARRRVEAEIDEDELMSDLVDQEREWYYEDSDSPFTQTITVTVGDDEYSFTYHEAWGEKQVWDDDHRQDVDLGSRTHRMDMPAIESAIWMHLVEVIGIDTSQAVDREGLKPSGFIPTKWDSWATERHSAVAGSYREMQLLLPQGAVGDLINRKREGVTYTVYDKDGNAQSETAIGEERAKKRAEEIGGRYEKNNYPVPITERNDAPDFYYTTHFPEANILGFFRFDERIDQDGKRVMFIQEIQSDWGSFWYKAQKAEKNLPAMRERMAEMNAAIDTARQKLKHVLDNTSGNELLRLERKDVGLSESAPTAAVEALAELHALLDDRGVRKKLQRDINDAEHDIDRKPVIGPFADATPKWTALVVKRIIAHAVEYGFDRVAWTTGAQQVERWKGGLRQQIDRIEWDKTEKGVHIVALKNGEVRQSTRYAETELTDAIGKLMSDLIFNDPNQSGVIEGNDITIDDIGMAASYDRIIPNTVNDLLRRLDKEVKVREIQVGKVRQYSVAPDPDVDGRWIVQQDGKELVSHPTKERAEANVEELIAARAATELGNQLGFDISDKIRDTAERGMPLFSERRRRASERKADNRRAWYYSQLGAAVNDIPKKIRTGKEAAVWLQANASKLGIKKDELVWSGVLDYLQTQPTPAGVSDWLRDNGVKVKDVMLGEESEEYRRLDAELQAMDGEIFKLRKAAVNILPMSRGVLPLDEIRGAAAGDRASSRVLSNQFSGDALDAMLAYGAALNRKNELFEQRKAARGEPVKYDSDDLVLPGGSKYRELLLTLPENAKPYTYSLRESDTSQWEVMQNESFSGYAVYDKDLKSVSGSFNDIEDARDWLRQHRKDKHYDVIENETGKNVIPRATPSLTLAEGFVESFNKQHVTDPKSKFTSSHFNAPNILAHLRFNERTDADGKRVLFIEEVQSDWSQAARKERKKLVAAKAKELGITVKAASKLVPLSAGFAQPQFTVIVEGNQRGQFSSRAEAEKAIREKPLLAGGKIREVEPKGPPLAPFVTDTQAWTALALKRAIAYAVDNGFDRVAWTTGEQQADRYDLSKQVSYVRAIRNSDDTYWVMAVQSRETGNGTGDILFDKDKLTAAELEDTIGKDLAAKIVKQEKRKEHEYTGLDLKVGGEGMVAFYDGIVKQVARSLGATVGTVRVSTGADVGTQKWTVRFADGSTHNSSWTEKSIAEQIARKEDGDTVVPAGQTGSAQPGFDITDEMRQQARIGMPLFSTQRRPSPELEAWLGKSVVRTPMYHGTSRDISTFRPKQADAIFLTDNPKFAGDFADLSRGWMLNNYWTWMTPEQIAEAKQRARAALPPTGREREREMLRIDQSQGNSPYLRKEIERMMPSESNIMPLYVRAENPFDFRNPAHVAAIEAELGPSWIGHEFINGEMFEVAQHIGDLERGDWNAIESPQVQEYIRKNHDSFYVRERGVTNLAVFSPNQVKSASGNQGTYSREDNDIRRSERRFQPSGHGQYLTELKNVARDLDSNDHRTKQYAQSRLVKVMDMPAVLRQIVDGTRGKVFRNVPQRIVGSGTTLLVKPMDQHVTSKHDGVVNPKVIFDLPKYLADPLAVFSGEGGTNPDSFRIVLRDRFDGKNPVVAIEPQAGHGFVMTIHTGSDSGLQRWIDGGLLHYVDEKAAGLRPAAADGSVGGSIPRIPNVDWSVAKERAEDKGRVVVTRDQVAGMDEARLSTPRSRITGQPINQTWTDPDVTDWDDLVRKMQDDKIDTKRVLRAIRDAGVAVKEKFDAYMLETNYHGRAAARVDAFADGELRKLLEDMAMRKLSMEDLDDYLWARHAPERNAANRRSNPQITDGSGMSDAQAADILAGRAVTINGRTIQLSAAALRSAAAVAGRVDAITNGTLDLLVQYGLETQQTVDTWRRTYGSYVPLKRDMESDANYSGAFGLGNGTGSGFSVRGAASKRAMGSKRTAIDILANVAMQRERAITRGEKNRVAQAVYGLALSAPNGEFWIPVNPELNKKLSPAALAKVVAELVALGVNPIDAQNLATEPVQRYIDPKTGLEAQRINPALRGREDVLSTRINGEDRYVMFSNKKRAQAMVRGLKNLDAAQVSGALQVIAPVTRWFASVNTQFNPVFGLTNGVRDFSTGMLNLSSTPLSADRGKIAAYAWDALKGIYLDLRDHRAGRTPRSQWAQLFEQFELDGGRTGYRDMFQTSADRATAIAKELEHAGKGKQWVLGGEKHSAVFGWLSDYNTAVENAMRLAAYKAALDKGMSRDAAASLAKNLTVNFNKKGLAATQTGALYAFFNAAVQGTARIAETVSKDGKLTDVGKKIIYGGMMVGVMQALMGALAGWDDDEPPQFAREKNLLIPVPGTDKYASIPMPLGFHVLPNIGRTVTEFMMSGFKDPGKRVVRLAKIILDAFNPIGSGTWLQTVSPTIGDPIAALSENEDWTGKAIYKADFNKLHPTPGWTRTKDTASPPSKWLAYWINYVTGGGKYEIGMLSPTPDQIDYLVGQATGGTGRELLKTAQYVSSKVTGEELPIYKTPLGVGRFVGETKGQSSETSKFYRNLERIGEHKSALDEMKDARDSAALQTYLTAHPEARLVQLADKAQREIGYLRRQKRELIEKGASKERVRLLDDRITAMTRRYNEMLKSR